MNEISRSAVLLLALLLTATQAVVAAEVTTLSTHSSSSSSSQSGADVTPAPGSRPVTVLDFAGLTAGEAVAQGTATQDGAGCITSTVVEVVFHETAGHTNAMGVDFRPVVNSNGTCALVASHVGGQPIIVKAGGQEEVAGWTGGTSQINAAPPKIASQTEGPGTCAGCGGGNSVSDMTGHTGVYLCGACTGVASSMDSELSWYYDPYNSYATGEQESQSVYDNTGNGWFNDWQTSHETNGGNYVAWETHSSDCINRGSYLDCSFHNQEETGQSDGSGNCAASVDGWASYGYYAYCG